MPLSCGACVPCVGIKMSVRPSLLGPGEVVSLWPGAGGSCSPAGMCYQSDAISGLCALSGVSGSEISKGGSPRESEVLLPPSGVKGQHPYVRQGLGAL